MSGPKKLRVQFSRGTVDAYREANLIWEGVRRAGHQFGPRHSLDGILPKSIEYQDITHKRNLAPGCLRTRAYFYFHRGDSIDIEVTAVREPEGAVWEKTTRAVLKWYIYRFQAYYRGPLRKAVLELDGDACKTLIASAEGWRFESSERLRLRPAVLAEREAHAKILAIPLLDQVAGRFMQQASDIS